MTIVEKKPHTDFKFLNVQSKKLSDLERELGLSFIKENLGRGIMLLSQTYNEYDEPNIMIEEIKVFGAAYFIKAGMSKIMEITQEDLEFIRSLITFENSEL